MVLQYRFGSRATVMLPIDRSTIVGPIELDIYPVSRVMVPFRRKIHRVPLFDHHHTGSVFVMSAMPPRRDLIITR